MPRVGRWSMRSGPIASPRASRAWPVPGPAGSGSSSSPAANAASWPTGAPPTCSRRATSGPRGSSARTRSICRPTRCSASRSERPAGGPSSSPGRGMRRSASTSPRSGRCWPAAGGRRADWSKGPRRTCCSRPRPKPKPSSVDAPSTGCSTSPLSRSSSGDRRARRSSPGSAWNGSDWRSPRSTSTATDTTGAGDAFDAGFLVGWFASRRAGRSVPASLQRAAVAGHRAAARQLSTPRAELPLL